MRVAVVAESFLPHMNGVTGSVLQVTRHLAAAGHETLVIAPRAPGAEPQERTALLRSVPLPSYPQVRIVFARAARLSALLRDFAPDVVHLASPFVLGWQGVAAADALRVPTVAVYQTDVAAYAQRYGVPGGAALAATHLARLHRRATLTLAPSSASMRQLSQLGIDRLRLWGRGVDADLFAPERRSEALRGRLAPGRAIVGYVGRLAPEKQVEDLRALADLPGVQLVVVGDGPSRPALERALPGAVFLGHLSGLALAEAVASFDVCVHPGESETFGQTIQEALASGVPVVATGAGGPIDLVRQSIDGWLYRPGDLGEMRARVADLLGDDAKRRAFAAAARESTRDRTWHGLTSRLLDHYAEAQELRPIDDGLLAREVARPERGPRRRAEAAPARAWRSYVALGDSLTEGLCDTSRMAAGRYRGWADRLASLLAPQGADRFRYANLAVRSRRVRHLVEEQVPAALALQPELVSILMGSNDLVGHGCAPVPLARQLEGAVRQLRGAGCDVLLVTPFLPRRRAALLFAKRFATYNAELRRVARETGAMLLDLEALPAIGDLDMWADDKVHLRSRGHRFLAYRAAEVLGLPHAEALGGLDATLHADEDLPLPGSWLVRDALPWAWRRLRGRTAGHGLTAKHDAYVDVTSTLPAAADPRRSPSRPPRRAAS